MIHPIIQRDYDESEDVGCDPEDIEEWNIMQKEIQKNQKSLQKQIDRKDNSEEDFALIP